jgi:Spy/CpxP family protein refolding chaperone
MSPSGRRGTLSRPRNKTERHAFYFMKSARDARRCQEKAMRTPFLIAVAAFVLVVSRGAQAQEPTTRPQRPVGRPRGLEARGMGFQPTAQRLAERLELTPEQKPQYDKIVAKYQAQSEEQAGQRDQLRELATQYREARQSGDEAKAEQLRQQMQDLRAGRTQLLQDFFNEVAPILNPDQTEKLNRFRERFQLGGREGWPGELQAILRTARRLELSDEQKERLRQVVREAQTEQRQGPPDPKAAAELAQRVKTQILEFLDAKQAAEFERLLAQPASRPAGPARRPGGPGAGKVAPQGVGGHQQRERAPNR